MRYLIPFLALLVSPLPALALPESLNDSICGMAAGSSYTDFAEYLERNELALEYVLEAKCTIGDFHKRDANFLALMMVSNPGIISMTQHISRYLIRNGHIDLFIKLIKAEGYKYNFFEELMIVFDNSSPDKRKSVTAAANMICTKIVNSRNTIEELRPLYDTYCLTGPLSLDFP